jgi:hypothetical protein
MKWLRVDEPGCEVCYLFPERGETEARMVAAVAAASFNSAWPEGYGWELYDPLLEARLDNVDILVPEAFARTRSGLRPRSRRDVLALDYVQGRRCKTWIRRASRGEHRGALGLSAGEFEAARGDVERLLASARTLLATEGDDPSS